MSQLTTTVAEAISAVLGSAAVTTDPAELVATSHDTWPLSTKRNLIGDHPNQADILVCVDDVQHIPTVLRLATEAAVPVTVRALGSSVTGQPLPVCGGIVLDVSGLPESYTLDETNMTVTASASYNGGTLEDELQAQGWTTAMSPQSLYRSSVGGWIATLATGQFSSLYGGIEDLATGYTVVLATGESIELKASPRAAMGPDLRQIFIGSEGTLGVITSVTLKVFPLAESQYLQTFSMPTVKDGLSFMREQVALGLKPFLIRFYDTEEARHAMVDSSIDTPVLFLGSRGVSRMAETELAVLSELAEKHGGIALGSAGAEAWMERRFDFSTVEKLLASPGGFAETIEVAHNWSQINELHAALKQALAPYADEVLAHFSHVYTQGTSMYLILMGRTESDEAAVARLETIWSTAMEVCLSLGAELSHHHGGGLARSPYARRSLGDAHLILRKLKAALDPSGILNPGKLGL